VEATDHFSNIQTKSADAPNLIPKLAKLDVNEKPKLVKLLLAKVSRT
jgi:hypothetical protein